MWGELEDVPKNERLQTIDAEAAAKWASKSHEHRAEFEACAMRKSKASRFPDPHCTAQGHVVPAGPLQLAALDGVFPVEHSAVEEHQSQFGFARVVDQFERRRVCYTEERKGLKRSVSAAEAVAVRGCLPVPPSKVIWIGVHRKKMRGTC